MTLERMLTAAIALFGIVFVVWVIPVQVETVSFGRIVPATVPLICLGILTFAAIVQLFTSKHTVSVDAPVAIRAVFFVALLFTAVWLMERYGFEYIAPALALVVMWAIGERRWYWLLVGGALVPIGVWLLVERVLDRVLA